ncbi:hypothetical protein DICPUDRAFT_25418 [Dictyostelium purpureum]|uniref:EamA domain-containing protein n=1 Tax=Dictyostelium purpureum TaxID=5786 RepID=F0Z712_DICPU|nr:uncharacterized protein DICPUDRAFT_25418 [Dictyostelium purpureum]EGC40251.1 hypothetical protein DICPUDRAFT_25418 [Dictyostelium purpureum]|eukprot:XP_003283187.1 hypothetical protein DICPUDRAFT_25418 [Dictyostelium purpureum]
MTKQTSVTATPDGIEVLSSFSTKDTKIRSLFLYCLFLVSGVCNTLLVQLIYNNISFNPKSMLTNICIFFGYAMLKFFDKSTKKNDTVITTTPTTTTTATATNNTNLNSKDKKESTISLSPQLNNNTSTIVKKQSQGHLGYLVLAIFDCLASLLTTIGQIAVGSGLFQVLFSSKIIFAAILSKFWLKKHVSKKKWLSIFIIFFGLCVTVKPKTALSYDTSFDSTNQNNTLKSTLYIGTFWVLLASFIFSASHIYTESVLKKDGVKPFTFGSKYGIYSVLVCIVYICTVTFYNRSEWIEQPINRASYNDQILVVVLFSILMVTSVARSSSMYTILDEHGTVFMGVLYSLQSIIVFGTSALFLCDPTDPIKHNQCISSPKLLGSVMVVFGVFLYNSSDAVNKNNLHKS